MDITSIKLKSIQFIGKYKYTIFILLIGLLLIMTPNSKTATVSSSSAEENMTPTRSMNEELSEILSKIQGAGAVQVYLTFAAGEKTIYQTDEEHSTHTDSSSTKIKTVVVSSENRSEVGLIQQVNPPEYMGALIVCQGADSPAVQLSIVDAVSKLTGLGADKISVLKMK